MWFGPAFESFKAWFQHWAQQTLVPLLKVQLKLGLVGVLDGAMDVLLLLGVLTTTAAGGNAYMNRQYALPRQVQQQVITWAAISERVAREADIPPITPLVLWYKESGLAAVNPVNCEGILGLHDLIVSGEHACFAPGPVGPVEIVEQLRIGAREFKERCRQIHYTTTDPDKIKHCYLAYNAGAGVRTNPDRSAYVMNGYDGAHQNMVHRDVQGTLYRLRNLGAWPAHLAIESLLLNLADSPAGVRVNLSGMELAFAPAIDTLIRWRDQLADGLDWPTWLKSVAPPASAGAGMWRVARTADCSVTPHTGGDPDLRPNLDPVVQEPVLSQDLHGCDYGLPGLDIGSKKDPASPLQSPMPGQVVTFTDQWQNTTIRIENAEWIVIMLHPRSYLVRRGEVLEGRWVGVMGAQGRATGPHVHFSIYDKINKGYVDPGAFIPALPKAD